MPPGRARRKRRPVPSLKATLRLVKDDSKDEPVEEESDYEDASDSDDDGNSGSESQPQASFSTPKKEKPKSNASRGARGFEGSPPKMRSRSGKNGEKKITEFFKVEKKGADAKATPDQTVVSELATGASAVNGAVAPSEVEEEKENEASRNLSVSFPGKASPPAPVRVRVCNREPGPVVPPPHRIQSPMIKEEEEDEEGSSGEKEEARAEASEAKGEQALLSPSTALNKLAISISLPEKEENEAAEMKPPKMAAKPGPKPKARRQLIKKANGVAEGGKQTTLEEYFQPVRRSSRRTKEALEKEKESMIIQAVRSGCEEGLLVHVFPNKGRGVVTARKFNKGDFVIEYSGDLINMKEAELRESNYARDKTAGCYMYYFEHQNRQLCVDATKESGRLGRLINHSRSHANLTTKTVVVDGKPRLVFFAGRDLDKSEELLYDYGDRSKESLANHPWLAF